MASQRFLPGVSSRVPREAVVTPDFKASELAVKSEYPEYWRLGSIRASEPGQPGGEPGDVRGVVGWMSSQVRYL